MGWATAATAAIGAVSKLAGGFSANSAAKQESQRQQQQGDILLTEAKESARIKADDVRHFQARQANAYASSGVTVGMTGYTSTPVQMLDETRRKGQAEVDAILRRGTAQRNLMYSEAAQTRQMGRASMFSGILGAAGGAFGTYTAGKEAGLW